MKKIALMFVALVAGAFASMSFAGQDALGVNTAVNPSGYRAPQVVDAHGATVTNSNGTKSALNITTATVVQTVAAGAQRVVRFVVNVAGAAGGIYDSNVTGGATAANLIAVMPATVGIYEVNFPVASGIVVSPGASQVVAVSYQ